MDATPSCPARPVAEPAPGWLGLLALLFLGGCAIEGGQPAFRAHDSEGYRPGVIARHAQLIQLAYHHDKDAVQDPPPFQEHLEHLGTLVGDDHHHTGMEIYGYLARFRDDPDTGIVALRGTADVREWHENLKVKLVASEAGYPGRVEKGFQQIYRSLRLARPNSPALVDTLQAVPVRRWIIVGHSLGAALATLLAADLVDRQAIPVELITLASPRVGNADFRDYVENGTTHAFRIVNDADLVPRVPWQIMGYRHVGQLFRFDARKLAGFHRSILCEHSLDTYRHALDPDQIPLADDCHGSSAD